MKDLDGDGKPELIYGSAGAVRFAKPGSGAADRAVDLDAGR